MLKARGITKRFGYFQVLKGVDIELNKGELLLLLGPNGAGKTTLTKILSTLTKPTSGEIVMDGTPLSATGRNALRGRLGYLSHQTFLYSHLTASENLRFFGALLQVKELERKIPDLLDRVGLMAASTRQVGTYSRGMQQRLTLARVMLPDPAVLILDEPYTGLDPEGTSTLTSVLGSMKSENRTLLLITHEIEACLPISDRMAVLCKGRISFESKTAGMALQDARLAYSRAVQ